MFTIHVSREREEKYGTPAPNDIHPVMKRIIFTREFNTGGSSKASRMNNDKIIATKNKGGQALRETRNRTMKGGCTTVA